MDHSEKVRRATNPRETANVFSLLSFTYIGGLLTRGFKKELEDDDLYEVVGKCRSKKCADKLEHAYFRNSKHKDVKVSLVKTLWNIYGIRYIALGAFHMTGRLLNSTLEPDAVSNLVGYFKPGQTRLTFYDACYFAGVMLGLRAFHTVYFQNYHIYLFELAIQIKVSLCSVIYRKALRLSPRAIENTSLGNIVTVMTKDVQYFEQAIPMFNDIWISILQTFLNSYLIYKRAGFSSMVGIFILLSTMPVQAYISKVIKDLKLKMGRSTDERLQRMQETLSSIKTVKMYTWEQIFADKIGESRYKEITTLMKSVFSRISLMISNILIGKLAFYAIIMCYIWLYNDMSPEDIFYVMKIFDSLKHTIGMSFTMGFSKLGELAASMKRIRHILELEELPEYIEKSDDEPQIDLRNVSLNLKERDILTDINLKLEVGLNVVTGPLGSGKSSLIKAILRDYPVNGEVRIRGRQSYVSQDPWLFPSSIKQNILFGEKYSFERYNAVVHACALEYDFGILEKGDETIVTDRGMNLSRGQQARVNLARAVYRDSDIYLIDDALTALDPRVQEHIFTNCIQKFLKGKCVVLITHNPKHIQQADKVVILKYGTINYVGQPQQNITEELFEALEIIEPEKKQEEVAKIENEESETEKLIKRKPQIKRKQVYHEVKKSGSVDAGLYLQYIKFGGGFLIIFLLTIAYFSSTFVDSASQKLLSNWINQKANITHLKEKYFKNATVDMDTLYIENDTVIFLNETFNVSTKMIDEIGRLEIQATKTLNLYSLSTIVYAATELLRHYLILRVSVSASIQLHKQMVKVVLNSVMTFFDTCFIGNILNRFSQDLNVVDEHLTMVMAMFVFSTFHLFGVVGLIASVNWKFMIPAIVLAIFSILIRAVYIRTARSLKRLEAATRSPIVGHLNSTMEGLTTIRAYKAQDILMYEFDKHQDLYTSAFYTSMCVNAGIGFIMEISSLLFVMSVIGRFLFIESYNFAGDVGLTLAQAGTLSMVIRGILMQWSDVEKSMTSMERAMEFITLENENTTGNEVDNWPSKGEIAYKHISLKYANSDDKILKDINFEVQARNKIGIVGRTGAGKSSIISVLFRLYNYEGQILIDGIDLKTLSLKFLRQHISIIPQDPIMFSGTIRSNIDPHNEFGDKEIWKTLHDVHLNTKIATLDTHVADTNFSTGERQLICLARAIIRQNKIVVLDEATANMDPETQDVAQKIIDEHFASCTMFIIAHRLDSILDCDKILVLDRGSIVEFDEPKALVKNQNGHFSRMLRNAGLHDVSMRLKSQ